MLQRLLAMAILLGLGWIVRRLFRTALTQRRGAQPRASTPQRDDGPLVRDRFCNTFLPRSRAIRTDLQGQELFFCSERCRQGFLADR